MKPQIGFALAIAALAVATTGDARHPTRAAAQAPSSAWLVARAPIGPEELARPLPNARWTLSFTFRLRPRTALVVALDSKRALVLRRDATGKVTLQAGGRRRTLRHQRGWPSDGRHRLELVGGPGAALAVDGRRFPVADTRGRALRIAAVRGGAQLEAVIAAPADEPASLLLHRLASLRLRASGSRFPIGTADAGDIIHYGRDWTTGFWPGALWNAAALEDAGGLLEGWALEATLANFGRERTDTHDLGFMYGRSSLLAAERICPAAPCAQLRRSALAAADGLVALAGTNRAAGLIPMRSGGEEADVIIDSVMNLGILAWASAETGRPQYAELASRHAHRLAELLVRPDGSTAQSVHVRRSDGTVLRVHTHQGLADSSAWARGQAWAVYGFADLGRLLADAGLVRVAERAAGFVAARLPAAGVPPWDYDAPPGAPTDVSAGAITAAGLLRLDAACRSVAGACEQPARWRPLAERMLAAALRGVRSAPPLGRLGGQVYSLGGRYEWEDHAELMFGVDYALEALAALRRE